MKRILTTLSFVLLCIGSAEFLHAQRQSWFILPQDTDAQIDTATEAHYVCLNKSVPAKNQLFLFFPGTGALPAYYQLISNTAADMGFHVINLRYYNFNKVNTLYTLRRSKYGFGLLRQSAIRDYRRNRPHESRQRQPRQFRGEPAHQTCAVHAKKLSERRLGTVSSRGFHRLVSDRHRRTFARRRTCGDHCEVS